VGSSANPEMQDEIITNNTNKTGSYYLLVAGYQGAFNPALCYTLNITVSGSGTKESEEIVPDLNATAHMEVYPNPARDVLNIDYTSETEGNVKLSLININGQVILERDFSATEGQNHSMLSLEGISNGLYIIKMTRNGENVINKFMINR
jgi:hypothetical protein